MGKCKIPPSGVPTQQVKVLSPKKASVDGDLRVTLKTLCHTSWAVGVHLNHPLIAYSCGNLVVSLPIVFSIGSVALSLAI